MALEQALAQGRTTVAGSKSAGIDTGKDAFL